MTDIIIQAFEEAINLILSGNQDFFAVVGRSLYASGFGTLLACSWSIPIAIIVGLYSFKGKWVIKSIFSALIGVPTVALGLILYLFLSNQGLLGFLDILYTVNGIALGHAILVTPLIVTFVSSALSNADIQLRDLAQTLGASDLQTNLTLMRETVWSMTLAVITAFNRGFGELGIAMMVGGNIFQRSRVLTTSIAVETNLGHFHIAMAYAIVLMGIVLTVTLIINLIERLRQEELPWKRRIWKNRITD